MKTLVPTRPVVEVSTKMNTLRFLSLHARHIFLSRDTVLFFSSFQSFVIVQVNAIYRSENRNEGNESSADQARKVFGIRNRRGSIRGRGKHTNPHTRKASPEAREVVMRLDLSVDPVMPVTGP